MSLTSAKNIETNIYELELKVDSDTFKKAIDTVYKRQVKNIQLPGFRKGKAPQKMIENMYGKGFFWEDAVNESYPAIYDEAAIESKLDIIVQTGVEIKDMSIEDGVTLVATVVTSPEIEIGEYKGVKADFLKVEVTDEEVTKELENLAERNARIITVEDRVIEDGDMANIDFEGFKDEVAFEGGSGESFDLTIGSSQFIPGFEKQIIGKKIGEEFDVNVTFPEDYHAEDLKGAEAIFKVTVNSATFKETPEIDDEFVKDVSEFDTLDEFKKDIKEKLTKSKEDAAQSEFENRVIKQITETIKGEIPEEMYEIATDEQVRNFENQLAGQGMNLPTYLQFTGMEVADFRESLKPQAERQVKTRLVLEKISKSEKIEITDEDLKEEYSKIADMYGMEADDVKNIIDIDMVSKDIKMNKAVDIINEFAVKNEVLKTEEKDAE